MQKQHHRRNFARGLVLRALEFAGQKAEGAARLMVREVRHRLDKDGMISAQGRVVVEQISRGADTVIAKSPVPIPEPMRDAMGKMQDALGQLSHATDLADWEERCSITPHKSEASAGSDSQLRPATGQRRKKDRGRKHHGFAAPEGREQN